MDTDAGRKKGGKVKSSNAALLPMLHAIKVIEEQQAGKQKNSSSYEL